MSDHFFVVTGGPGAGKTSLILELARRGFHTPPNLAARGCEATVTPSPAPTAWPTPDECWSGTSAPTAQHRHAQAR